jgi:DNA primase
MRERLSGFFNGGRGPQRRGQQFQPRGGSGGRSDNTRPQGRTNDRGVVVSDRLARSGLVRGHRDLPALRESVLALTVVNHPQLLLDDYDEIASVDFENRDLQRFWSCLLTTAAKLGARLDRDNLREHLEDNGFEALLATMNQQVRNARLWTATAEADLQDVVQAYRQAYALHSRNKELRWQKIELEREIAETAADEEERASALIRALSEVQLEIGRLENQEAIIDGFGVMSGRVKGAAVGHG